ncbi:MAG: hypothetical protein GC186_19990 [Rhodobacteraceae bacterium]|nr:hypothetical protein [Paracoccaceae bacterium]
MSSDYLRAIRWPAVFLSAVTGLVPHIMVLYSTPTVRLGMILVMHAAIVPIFTAFVLRALESRARNLEVANDELRRRAEDLARRQQQNDALNSAFRLLSGAPSVHAILTPLAEAARLVARASGARLNWQGAESGPEAVLAGILSPSGAPNQTLALSEGGTELGWIVFEGGIEDNFTATSLSMLASEIGLRWRLRRTEANALSAIHRAGEGNPVLEGDRQTGKLLAVICEAVQADGARLYIHETEGWQPRAQRGAAPDAETAAFDAVEGFWRSEDGRTICIRGAADGILVLNRRIGALPDAGALNLPLLRMIVGHSVTLLRVTASYQAMLWSERRRIARELHDDVCQSIAALHLQLGHLEGLITSGRSEEAAARSRQLREAAIEAYDATRMAVDGFREKPRDGESGQAFLARISRLACERQGVALEIDAHCPDLGAEAAWQLGRIIQEAVSNAARHGKAETIHIDIREGKASTQLVLRDDGGFARPQAAARTVRGRHGLDIMAERVGELNGTFDIARAEDATTLRIEIPRG